MQQLADGVVEKLFKSETGPGQAVVVRRGTLKEGRLDATQGLELGVLLGLEVGQVLREGGREGREGGEG